MPESRIEITCECGYKKVIENYTDEQLDFCLSKELCCDQCGGQELLVEVIGNVEMYEELDMTKKYRME